MARAAPVAVDVDEAPVAESPPPKPSRRKWILAAVMVLVLLGAGGAAAWHFMSDSEEYESEPSVAVTSGPKVVSKGKAKQAEKNQDRKPSVFMNLENMTVNLQADTSERYLQTTIVFELADEKAAEAVKAQMPVIRSKLLLLLSSKNAGELLIPGGKETLALQIIDEARKHVALKPPEKALLNVHFNAFVIQ